MEHKMKRMIRLRMLVPLLIKDLVFSNALVLASIGTLDDKTQYYFLEAALALGWML
jgi:hypothetical protein